ncbi:MAG: hypothetical protein KIS62_19530 [Ramlibacter sp.]|nr:hypothetical protein [Ramlibacter sp.]MBX3660488.1 hypothetical protein [Ramlibacter sp.]MCW5651944.1 hypothetical protein [Ramlibacter sp.]
MLQAARTLLASGLLANGAAMMAAPSPWFHTVPGVDLTGALNPHFVRDVGAAYLCAGLGLLWRARAGRRAAPAAWLGAGFLLLHAGVHLAETLAGVCGWGQFLADAPGVVLPALAAAGLAATWPREGAAHA